MDCLLSVQLNTLKRIARVGDRHTVRCLMTFLRNSWEYVKVRGNDTDIKLEVAQLLFHLLAFKDHDKIEFLYQALQHPHQHLERDRIGEIFVRMSLTEAIGFSHTEQS
jgi:hypothetical protein